MQIDVTVRDTDGTEHDVRLTAPATTPLGLVLDAISRRLLGIRPVWLGTRRLDDAGASLAGLQEGAVLSVLPVARHDGFGLRLEVVGGPDAGRSVGLAAGTTVVGRAPDCDVVLRDPTLSRHHVAIRVSGREVCFGDLGSAGGTWLVGERVRTEQRLAAGEVLRCGDTYLALARGIDGGHADPARDGTIAVHRFVGADGPPTDAIVELPVAARSPQHHASIGAALAPAVAGVALAAVMRSVEFLAFAALTPLTLVTTTVHDRVRLRRARRRSEHAHGVASGLAAGTVREALRVERRLRHSRLPGPAELGRIAAGPTRPLWHRAREDAGLLVVRAGLGAEPSALRVRRGEQVEPAETMADVPVPLDLAAGPVMISGPLRFRLGLAAWLLAQLAVHTSPADIEIAVCADSPQRWRWLRWLPHVRSRIAGTPAECRRLVAELTAVATAHDDRSERSAPHRIVVVVDDPRSSAALGAALAGRADPLVTMIDVSGGDRPATPGVQRLGAAGGAGTRGRLRDGAEFVADTVTASWATDLARALAPLRDAGGGASRGLPDRCRLVELIGLDRPSPAAVVERWARGASSLRLVIGSGESGPVEVDLDEDGPHVLIAGTTGAGKSELLQTLVVAAAVSAAPTEVTFLLVDYKGGAALARFATVPHCVGVVTDLDERLAGRVLTALRAELRRRERILAAAGVSTRAEYCGTGGVLPRLVIVVDEFAALAEQGEGLVGALVQIAQRGRSLGVHLVLATQRPGGAVTADIRANVSVRIALRTTTAVESSDIVDDGAAATLDPRTPGRAYLRTGTGLRLLQCAQVSGRPALHEPVRVDLLDDWRRPRDPAPSAPTTDLDDVLAAISSAARGLPVPRRPWLPPLPDRVAATGLAPVDVAERIPVGLADCPAEQCRDVVTVDLAGGGGVLFTGSSRSGRSSALLVLALGAVARLTPAALHVHAVGGVARHPALQALPHVGTLAPLDDGGRLAARLVERLAERPIGHSPRTAGPEELTRTVLLIDDWEALCEAVEHLDGGRTVERVLALVRDGPGRRLTVAVAGGRATLASRLTGTLATRFVLRLHDRADYAGAGVDPARMPAVVPPGRAIRVEDGTEIQFADPTGEHAPPKRAPLPPRGARLVLHPLPDRVALDELRGRARPAGRGWLLGVGGDAAAPVVLDLHEADPRLLVAGPPGSGKTSLLRTILAQCDHRGVCVAAARGSPLAEDARHRGLPVLSPEDPDPTIGTGVLLVDDSEAFTGTVVGDRLAVTLRATGTGPVAVVAARSEALAVAAGALATELRGLRHGVLLQPGPLDGELLSARVGRAQLGGGPGRGLLVPDPRWHLGRTPIQLQVAEPGPLDDAQPMCG